MLNREGCRAAVHADEAHKACKLSTVSDANANTESWAVHPPPAALLPRARWPGRAASRSHLRTGSEGRAWEIGRSSGIGLVVAQGHRKGCASADEELTTVPGAGQAALTQAPYERRRPFG
jgi:hypothetical protein